MVDSWTSSHFSLSNPAGTYEVAVPLLLRRVADAIEELGNIDILDITFASEVVDGHDEPSMTVYFNPTSS